MRRQNDAHRAIHPRQLFNNDGVIDVAQPGAAQVLRENGPHVAQPAQLPNHFARKLLRLIPFHDVRGDFGFGEFAHRFT